MAYTKDNVHKVFYYKTPCTGGDLPSGEPCQEKPFPILSCCAAMSYNVKGNLFPVVQMLHGNFLHSAKRCAAMTYSDKAAR